MELTSETIDYALKDLKKLPSGTLDDISQRIHDFNSKPSAELTDEYIHNTVETLSYVFFSILFTVNDKKEFWRARPSDFEEIFEHTDDLKYPPKGKTKYGRANSCGSSVFYAASSPVTLPLF